jgi:hypothetical protein
VNQIIWEQIDPALARGDVIDPRVWDYIDRVIGVKRAIPEARLSSTITPTGNAAPTPRDIGNDAIADVSTPDVSTVTVNGVNHEAAVTAVLIADGVLAQDDAIATAGEGAGGGQLDGDDKLEWLADAATNAPDDPRDALFDDVNVVPKAAPRQPRLTLSTEALEKYLAKMSWQRRDAFTWLDKHIDAVLQADIDNELSFRKAMNDINNGKPKSRQISHETVRKAFNDYCKVSDYEAVKMSAS